MKETITSLRRIISEMLEPHVRGLRLLREGGHAFEDVKPIALEDFQTTWPRIKKDIMSLGVTKIDFIGSTGKKPLMGDVDLVIEYPGSRDDLFTLAVDKFGADAVAKVGATLSISYPVYKKTGKKSIEKVQVDLMLGKSSYVTWSRFGTSTMQDHTDYSPVKGVVRNYLLGAIYQHAAELQFPGQQSEFERVKYNIDFDKGLFKTIQTKLGKSGKPLADWKVVEREFVTDDPDTIVRMVLGKRVTAHDVRTFEGLVEALRKSPLLKSKFSEIMSDFYEQVKENVGKRPTLLGDDPAGTLKYLKKVSKS
jgi:hypothetical protein